MFSRRSLLASLAALLAGLVSLPVVIESGNYRYPESVGCRRWIRWSDGRCSFVRLDGSVTTLPC